MPKYLYVVLLASTIVMIFAVLLFIIKRRSKLATRMKLVLSIGILTTVSYLMTIVFKSSRSASFFYSLYFLSMTNLCTALFSFIATFTDFDNHLKKYKIWYFIIPIVLLDSINMFLNFFFEHAASYQEFVLKGGTFWEPVFKFPFYIHLFICYIFVGLIIFCLIFKAIKSPIIFKSQYYVILGLLVLIVSINALFLGTSLAIDISIIGYGILAVIITFYTFLLLPRLLNERMSDILISNMDYSLMVFSYKGDFINENKKSKEWFPKSIKTIDNINNIFGFNGENEKEIESSYTTIDGVQRILVFKAKKLYTDTKKGANLIGYYFTANDVTEKRKALLKREYESNHDMLTGFYSYQYFMLRMKEALQENLSNDYALAVFSLKFYKEMKNLINESNVNFIALEFTNFVKEHFINDDSIYGLYSDDKVLVFGEKNYLINTIKETFMTIPTISYLNLNLVLHAGIYLIRNKENEISDMISKANIALGYIKNNSSQKYSIYNEEMKAKILRETELINMFPDAIKNDEFKIYIQPQVDSISKSLIGGEALVRWLHNGTIIPPNDFIRVFEKNGLITTLDKIVWEKTIKCAKNFYDEGYPISLSINISALDLISCDIYNELTTLIEKYDLPVKYLKLEITETEIMKNLDESIKVIEKLREYGFILEMDDFGSAYSSLNSLKDIPVDLIKLDMKFFDSKFNNNKSKNIIAGIINLINQLDLSIICEGVEYEYQSDFLASNGCTFIQGYLYGKPCPIEDFKNIRKNKEFIDIFNK